MTLARRATLGILGDGQLGRMLAQAAQRRGFCVHGFGQDPQSPLAQVTNQFTCAPFEDQGALAGFAARCDQVTAEFENVPVQALEITQCQPAASIFALAQDRLQEKHAAAAAGLRTAPFFAIDAFADMQHAATQTEGQGVLKTRRLGYDGKGQWRIDPTTDLAALWSRTPKNDLLWEGLIDFAFETSALVVRNAAGQMVTFPCGENRHRKGVLHQSCVPGQVTPEIEAKAQQWSRDLAESLELVGLLALEFFVLDDRSLVFNEMAPRPHNSGHWTLEACDQSQFDLTISALVGQPLRPPIQLSPAVMTNLFGDDICHPKAGVKCFWHDYGKVDPKAGRKMGHMTQLMEA